MDTKFKLITQAQEFNSNLQKSLQATIDSFAGIKVQMENVTHVLANIASKTDGGQPIELTSLPNIAGFMAGIEILSTALPNTQDPKKKQNALRVLTNCAVGNDGFINMACVPVVEIGSRNEALYKKYLSMLQSYLSSLQSGKPDGKTLSASSRQLQQQIDQAMRLAATPVRQAPVAAGPGLAGSAPSGT